MRLSWSVLSSTAEKKTETSMTNILHLVRDLHFASYHAAGSE